jgi:hypothetical protein
MHIEDLQDSDGAGRHANTARLRGGGNPAARLCPPLSQQMSINREDRNEIV